MYQISLVILIFHSAHLFTENAPQSFQQTIGKRYFLYM